MASTMGYRYMVPGRQYRLAPLAWAYVVATAVATLVTDVAAMGFGAAIWSFQIVVADGTAVSVPWAALAWLGAVPILTVGIRIRLVSSVALATFMAALLVAAPVAGAALLGTPPAMR